VGHIKEKAEKKREAVEKREKRKKNGSVP